MFRIGKQVAVLINEANSYANSSVTNVVEKSETN